MNNILILNSIHIHIFPLAMYRKETKIKHSEILYYVKFYNTSQCFTKIVISVPDI